MGILMQLFLKIKWLILLPFLISPDLGAYLNSKIGCIDKYPDKFQFTGKYSGPIDYQITFQAKGKYYCDFLDYSDKTELGCSNGMRILLLNENGQVRPPSEDLFLTKNIMVIFNNQRLTASSEDPNIAKNFQMTCDFKDLNNKKSKEIISNKINYIFFGSEKKFSISYVATSKIIFQ